MPQDFFDDGLLDDGLTARLRDRFRDTYGSTSNIHRSAAEDVALVQRALRQISLAKSALRDLSPAGSLPITRSLGETSTALQSISIAEQEVDRVLSALRRL